MALKATIYKSTLSISDMDRNYYGEHALTLAQHPSETDERLMIRILAFALSYPSDDLQGTLEFGKRLWDTEEADLWHKDLTGECQHWIDLGQPDLDRMKRAASRSREYSVWSYANSTPVWWDGVKNGVSKLNNLSVYSVPANQSQALAALATRSMQLQVMVQDSTVWVSSDAASVELHPEVLKTASSA